MGIVCARMHVCVYIEVCICFLIVLLFLYSGRGVKYVCVYVLSGENVLNGQTGNERTSRGNGKNAVLLLLRAQKRNFDSHSAYLYRLQRDSISIHQRRAINQPTNQSINPSITAAKVH